MAPRPTSRAPKKIFHKIGEVCELTKTEPYVLRYWESEFPFLAPEKNRAGQRIYSDEDIQTVLSIKRLLYEEGYTTAGARRRLEKELLDRRKGEPETPEAASSAPAAPEAPAPTGPVPLADDRRREALRQVTDGLQEIRALLARPAAASAASLASSRPATPAAVEHAPHARVARRRRGAGAGD